MIDLEALLKLRLRESVTELELARKFMEAGLTRNAAVKAFQSFKSILSAIAIRNKDLLAGVFKGKKRVRPGVEVEKVDWVAVVVPTSSIMRIAERLSSVKREVLYMASMALQIHEYQYNGPDREGILSSFTDDTVAGSVIGKFLNDLKSLIDWASGKCLGGEVTP